MQETQAEAQQDDNEDKVWQFFKDGGSLSALMGLDQENLDKLYAYAFQAYSAGECDRAKRFFLLLAQVDQWNFDYWFALGLCCQRLGEHEEAIFCFAQSAVIRLTDPRSAYWAGINYQLLGNQTYARKAFTTALKLCGQQAIYEELRQLTVKALASCGEEVKP